MAAEAREQWSGQQTQQEVGMQARSPTSPALAEKVLRLEGLRHHVLHACPPQIDANFKDCKLQV